MAASMKRDGGLVSRLGRSSFPYFGPEFNGLNTHVS